MKKILHIGLPYGFVLSCKAQSTVPIEKMAQYSENPPYQTIIPLSVFLFQRSAKNFEKNEV